MIIEFDFIRKYRIRKWMKRVNWHWKFVFCKKIGPRKFMFLDWYGRRYPHRRVYWRVYVEDASKLWELDHRTAMEWIRHGVERRDFPSDELVRKSAWIEDISKKTYANMKECEPEFCFKEDLAKDENGVVYNLKEAMDEMDGKSQGITAADPLGQR